MTSVSLGLVVAATMVSFVQAQELGSAPPEPPRSRAEEIELARQEKAKSLQPDEVSKAESVLRWVKDRKLMEKWRDGVRGFRPVIGKMATGGGFAAGPEWHYDDLFHGAVQYRANARFSTRGYQLYETQLTAPRLAGGRFFGDIYAVHHNYVAMPYYGPGPDSQETGRSQYRLDDTSIDATVGWRITPHWILGVAGGHVWVNTGPGNDRRFAQAQEQYSSVPGMQQQSDFGRGSVFLGFDWRDSLTGPRKGGIYGAELSNFWDRKLNRHDFSRLTLEAQQYVPVFNKRRVFAFRGRTVLTSTQSGKSVPFYFQPTLGGSDDLRGYRPFRFYGNNLLNLNAEYRWEIFSGLDMAVFWDGGKVFDRRSQFGLSGLESAVGFGFRANSRNATFLRLDVGFSHEGFQIWFKFNDVFSRRLIGSSSTQTVI